MLFPAHVILLNICELMDDMLFDVDGLARGTYNYWSLIYSMYQLINYISLKYKHGKQKTNLLHSSACARWYHTYFHISCSPQLIITTPPLCGHCGSPEYICNFICGDKWTDGVQGVCTRFIPPRDIPWPPEEQKNVIQRGSTPLPEGVIAKWDMELDLMGM